MRRRVLEHLAVLIKELPELALVDARRRLRDWVVAFGSATDDNVEAAARLTVADANEFERKERRVCVGPRENRVTVSEVIWQVEGMDAVINTVSTKLGLATDDVHAAMRMTVLLWSSLEEAGPKARRPPEPWSNRSRKELAAEKRRKRPAARR